MKVMNDTMFSLIIRSLRRHGFRMWECWIFKLRVCLLLPWRTRRTKLWTNCL